MKQPKKVSKGGVAQNSNKNTVKETRDKTILRDNWNYFVSDDDAKTDAILRFKKPHIKNLYEKHLIASSAYSLRILLGLITFTYLHVTTEDCTYNWRILCYLNRPLPNLLIAGSFFCTFPKFNQLYIASGL